MVTDLLFKSKNDDLEKIDELLDKQSAKFKAVWNKYLKTLKSEDSVKIIASFLEINREDLAIQYIEEQTDSFNEILLLLFLVGAAFEIGFLASSIIRSAKTVNNKDLTENALQFNQMLASDKLALEVNRFKSDLNESQRKLIYQVVAQGRVDGISPRLIAKKLAETLGMTEQQFLAVENYRRLLEGGSSEALKRELRDKRFDKTISRAIADKKPLTQEQIDRMVAAYRRRYIRYRSETMTRTVSGQIIEAGRDAAANQMLEKAGLQPGDMVKEWRSRRDDKVRYTHTHASLDGQKVKQNEYFISVSGARLLYPRDSSAPLKETVNCRCRTLRYIYKD